MDSFESNLNNNSAAAAAASYEDHHGATNGGSNHVADHGWQKVTYAKKQRNKQQKAADSSANEGVAVAVNGNAGNVFRSLEQQSEDRRRRIEAQQRVAAAAAPVRAVRSKHHHRSDDDDDDEDDSDDNRRKEGEGEKVEEKKVKQKKPKKPKVTVAEAAAKIDAADLAAFLADITGSYEGQQEIQLMRLADYFGRAFAAVSSAQFPWTKTFRESPVSKIADIPLSHISEVVYKTSIDWINLRSVEALGSFVVWCLDSILADLASQSAGHKASKKAPQQSSTKSQVAIFVVLAMVLRRKPDALVHVLPTLRESSKYQGHDKLPVVVWMIAQASQGDLSVGLYSWAHNLLPLVGGKSSNPQSRDMILQLVEKILSAPKARTVLVNGAVRRGERLVPPSSFEILVRTTYPASSAKVKATERFEAIYPTLKEVALAGSTGSKAMKQVAKEIQSFAVKAAGESIPELSKEAAGIFIWCLTQNADCYKQWDKVYHENLEASVGVLKKLSEDWKELSVKLAPLDPLRETLKGFRQKNEKAMTSGADATQQALFGESDKYCKMILSKQSRGHGCVKGMAVAVIAVAVGAAILSPNMESLDWKKLSVFVSSQFSF